MVNIDDLKIDAIRNILGVKRFHFQSTGSDHWTRVFVERSDGITIARLSFMDGVLKGEKWFKNKLRGPDIRTCESDMIQVKFWCWFRHQIAITDKEINLFIDWAKKEAAHVYKSHVDARSKLPTHNADGTKIKRKALSPPDYRTTFLKMMGSWKYGSIEPVTPPPAGLIVIAERMGLLT